MMTIENFQHLLLLALLLLVVTWPLSRICAWLRQPLVIAEILAGITLGPSVLGAIAPAAESYVVPTGVTPMLYAAGELGLVFYIFVLGIEFRLPAGSLLRRKALAIAASGAVVPCAAGIALATLAAGLFIPAGATGGNLRFALFIGAALSVTAFPVLARLLAALQITGTPLAAIALLSGAFSDTLAWLLLAGVLAMLGGTLSSFTLAVGGVIAAAVVALLVRRASSRAALRSSRVLPLLKLPRWRAWTVGGIIDGSLASHMADYEQLLIGCWCALLPSLRVRASIVTLCLIGVVVLGYAMMIQPLAYSFALPELVTLLSGVIILTAEPLAGC